MASNESSSVDFPLESTSENIYILARNVLSPGYLEQKPPYKILKEHVKPLGGDVWCAEMGDFAPSLVPKYYIVVISGVSWEDIAEKARECFGINALRLTVKFEMESL